MEKSYSSLLSLICAVRLDYKRVNDVTVTDGVLTIGFFDMTDSTGKSDTRICLKNAKGEEYQVSDRQLAGLRIATGAVTATWLDEFRTDANGCVFQVKARELVEKGKDLSEVKFKVVKHLKVKNTMINSIDTPVYKDNCYEGALEYTRGVRTLLAGKTQDFFRTAEYSRGMAELRERLHATAVKPGKGINENCVLLPVFEVI